MSANGGFGFFRSGAARFCLALCVHLLERQLVFFPVKLFGHPSVDKREVYRINVRIENDMIEVPDDNRERGQDRLVEMDGQSDVNPPTRKETEEADLEPDHQAGETHDEGAPDDGPVLGLLCITKARDLRLDALEAEIIVEVADHIAHVFQLWQHVDYPAPAVW